MCIYIYIYIYIVRELTPAGLAGFAGGAAVLAGPDCALDLDRMTIYFV